MVSGSEPTDYEILRHYQKLKVHKVGWKAAEMDRRQRQGIIIPPMWWEGEMGGIVA